MVDISNDLVFLFLSTPTDDWEGEKVFFVFTHGAVVPFVTELMGNHWLSAAFYCHETLLCLPIFSDLFCNSRMSAEHISSQQLNVSIDHIFLVSFAKDCIVLKLSGVVTINQENDLKKYEKGCFYWNLKKATLIESTFFLFLKYQWRPYPTFYSN